METILALFLQRVLRRAVTFLLTASAFSLKEPLTSRMSSTVGVVCAMAENSGERALGIGDLSIMLSRKWKSSVGLLVFAQR